jgi:hypothetical protein
LWSTAESIPPGNISGGGVTNFGAGGGGRYWVTVQNDAAPGETPTADTNGILVITSTGVGRNGATATAEVSVSTQTFPSILINGRARVRGNLSVKGTGGILHANNTLDVGGSPCADQYFSSSANIISPNNLKGAGCLGTGFNRPYQPIIPPPIYNIRNDFYRKADYIFGAFGTRAGKVYDFSGPGGTEKMLYNGNATGGTWVVGNSKWIWDPIMRQWMHTGDELPDGTYYSEGNFDIRGSFGTSSFPTKATFVAEGYIFVGGNKATLVPKYENYFLIAGSDLILKGNMLSISGELEAQGIVYAHHQIDFIGAAKVSGVVIAANQADTNSVGCNCNPVPLSSDGFMIVNGSAYRNIQRRIL